MDEVINFLIGIFYLIKYSKIFNSRNFAKEIPFYKEANETESRDLRKLIYAQLNRLKKDISGTPTLCLLDKKIDGSYKIIIVNEENKFCCRLNDTVLEGINDYAKCLVHL